MNRQQLMKAIGSHNIYQGSDKVIYLSWTMYVTSILFKIISVVLFLALIVCEFNSGKSVLYWLPIDSNIAIGVAVVELAVDKFMELLCEEPGNLIKQFRNLTKSFILLLITLSLSVLLITAAINFSNHDMIIFLSPLSTMSVLLLLFTFASGIIHLILIKPSFKQLLLLIVTFLCIAPISVIVLIEGIYSYCVGIWFNCGTNALKYMKMRQKLKRVIKITSIFLPSIFITLELIFNTFDFAQNIHNNHWLVFLCIASAGAIFQIIQKIMIDIYKWTSGQDSARKRKYNQGSLVDLIIDNLIESIVKNNKRILSIRYTLKVVKKVCMISIYVGLMFLTLDKNHLVPIVIVWICAVVTLIVILFDIKEWKDKMARAYKIGDIQLISQSLDIENDIDQEK